MIGLNESVGGVPLYQFKITLKWSKPPIWRRVVVRADMKLNRFHDVIQLVMPWTNSHLHQFIVGQVFYGMKSPEFEDDLDTLDEKRYRVSDLATAPKARFIYEYDFGDGWEHEILLEKILQPDTTFKHPICLAGANACPPDDCGGIPGYYNLLEVLADPMHPEHAQLKGWIGGKWDAEQFDLDETNSHLKKLKA